MAMLVVIRIPRLQNYDHHLLALTMMFYVQLSIKGILLITLTIFGIVYNNTESHNQLKLNSDLSVRGIAQSFIFWAYVLGADLSLHQKVVKRKIYISIITFQEDK